MAVLPIHIFLLWQVRDQIEAGDPDFTIFYTAARILREGRRTQLYEGSTQRDVQREFTSNLEIRRGPLPYNHPPFEALIFLPLTLLPYRQAFVVWNLANLAMLFAIALLLRRSTRYLSRISLLEAVLAMLAFFPVLENFLQGQDAVLLLLLFVLAYSALNKDADFSAGFWLGLATFKYHFALGLGLALVFWRGRKVALGFATTAGAAALVSLAMVGWHEALRYFSYAWTSVATPGYGQTPFGEPNLLGLLTGWRLLQPAGGPLRVMAVIASIGLLAAVISLRAAARDGRLFGLCVACAVTAAVLAGYNTNVHDVSLLVLPVALVADECALAWSQSRKISRQLIAPIVPVLLSPIWIISWMGWHRANVMAIFLLWWCVTIRRDILRRSRGEDIAAVSAAT